MAIGAAHVLRYLELLAQRFHEQRDYLTELDSAIGDADHGANLERGFRAVLARLPALADQQSGAILKAAGMTLISTVGGAAGPLYGTAFLRAGTALQARDELSAADLLRGLEAALEGIMARGKARRGEKTMLDALGPAVDALRAALERGVGLHEALLLAAAAAEAGMRATIPMLATKGRASYLGERSIGHQDPGATSAFLLTVTLAECC